MVYYNECDKPTAAWLRFLVRERLIAPGVVDERPIERVQPAELRGFCQCHFFAGIGGWSRALQLAGWPDDRPVWTGSCPCQPFSSAGKGRGFGDERDLWPHFFRLIAECRPVAVFGEQVDAAASRHGWLDRVADDLGAEGYAIGATVFPAAAVGAPHLRERLYFVADSDRGQRAPELSRVGPGPAGGGMVDGFWASAERVPCEGGESRAVEPGVRPLADGIPGYMGLMRGAGNAIVPQQAAAFIRAFAG
jgi:DNA (cytosine-5)-methyltransferase 1